MGNTAAEAAPSAAVEAEATTETPTTETAAEKVPATDSTNATAETQEDKTDWVKEARKWESRASENREDAKRWKEYVEKVKPEQDKLVKELEDTRAELQTLKLTALKEKVIAEVGLAPEAINRLQGSTLEELKKDAEDLKSLIGGASPVSRKPQPVSTQGVVPNSQQSGRANTIEEYEQIVRANFKKS